MMPGQFKALKTLYINQVPGYNAGDVVNADVVDAQGWVEGEHVEPYESPPVVEEDEPEPAAEPAEVEEDGDESPAPEGIDGEAAGSD